MDAADARAQDGKRGTDVRVVPQSLIGARSAQVLRRGLVRRHPPHPNRRSTRFVVPPGFPDPRRFLFNESKSMSCSRQLVTSGFLRHVLETRGKKVTESPPVTC